MGRCARISFWRLTYQAPLHDSFVHVHRSRVMPHCPVGVPRPKLRILESYIFNEPSNYVVVIHTAYFSAFPILSFHPLIDYVSRILKLECLWEPCGQFSSEKKPSPFSRRGAAPVNSMDVLSTLIVSARKFYFDPSKKSSKKIFSKKVMGIFRKMSITFFEIIFFR